jgi:hypothetical protein
MDERIESFLVDVLALEGEDENAVRHGVRVALSDYEQMKDKAAHACHALCRSRVVEEIKRRKGNPNRRPLKAGTKHHRGAALHTKGWIATASYHCPTSPLLAAIRTLEIKSSPTYNLRTCVAGRLLSGGCL